MPNATVLIPLLVFAAASGAPAAEEPVAIRFRAVVSGDDFACGHQYTGVGTTKSTIAPRDLRFYVHNVRLVDDAGTEVALDLDRDGKWQFGGTALLDFEDASAACRNGTPDTNFKVVGTVPEARHFMALRFTLGVPESQNHRDLTSIGSPLNLTAMAWLWNDGRRFLRLEFSSTGMPRGWAFHLGSTGCVNSVCKTPNRFEYELKDFDPARDVVVADISELLKTSDVDRQGCESDPATPSCGPLLARLPALFRKGRP